MLLIRRPQNAVGVSRAFHTSASARFSLLKSLENSNGEQEYVVKRRLNHSPKAFYNVVSDVSQYSNFVPYCTRSFINERDEQGEPSEAGIRVGWKTFDEEFVCNLKCEPSHTVIAESVTHSLFEHLYTKWTITPNGKGNSCDMELLLRFNFKSALYNKVSSLFAESVSSLIIKAFDRQAAKNQRKVFLAVKARKEARKEKELENEQPVQ